LLKERPRPEFTMKTNKNRKNPITGEIEPVFPASKHKLRVLAGITTIIGLV
jgi:hypothetical protein